MIYLEVIHVFICDLLLHLASCCITPEEDGLVILYESNSTQGIFKAILFVKF